MKASLLALAGLAGVVSAGTGRCPRAVIGLEHMGSSLQSRAAVSLGSWSGILPLPLSPLSGAVLPTGEVLLWSGVSAGGWVDEYWTTNGNRTNYVITTLSNIEASGPITLQTTVTSEMFCPGTTNLPDGSILSVGGSGPEATVLFDIKTKTFKQAAYMNIPRGYNANVLTTGDKAFTIGGSFERKYRTFGVGYKDGELFTPSTNGVGSWVISNKGSGQIIGGVVAGQPNPDPEGIYRSDNHAWLFAYKSTAGDDMVFHAGPVVEMNTLNTVKGTLTALGNRGTDKYSMNGNAIQYAPGLMLKVGGAPYYGNSNSSVGMPSSNAAYKIDATGLPAGGTPVVTALGPMYHNRTFSQSIVMPGGQVFVVGGQTNIALFSDQYGVLTPEIWTPSTGKFNQMTPMQVARNYHSLALLQPDGRVMVAGGGAAQNGCTTPGKSPCTSNVHFNAEVFTPPYLLTGATIPVITSVSGTSTTYGKKFVLGGSMTITVTGCPTIGCSFELIRLASVTHSVQNDQLRVPLHVVSGTTTAVVTVPTASAPWVVSGYYYLFALNGIVPSVAAMVQITFLKMMGTPQSTPASDLNRAQLLAVLKEAGVKGLSKKKTIQLKAAYATYLERTAAAGDGVLTSQDTNASEAPVLSPSGVATVAGDDFPGYPSPSAKITQSVPVTEKEEHSNSSTEKENEENHTRHLSRSSSPRKSEEKTLDRSHAASHVSEQTINDIVEQTVTDQELSGLDQDHGGEDAMEVDDAVPEMAAAAEPEFVPNSIESAHISTEIKRSEFFDGDAMTIVKFLAQKDLSILEPIFQKEDINDWKVARALTVDTLRGMGVTAGTAIRFCLAVKEAFPNSVSAGLELNPRVSITVAVDNIQSLMEELGSLSLSAGDKRRRVGETAGPEANRSSTSIQGASSSSTLRRPSSVQTNTTSSQLPQRLPANKEIPLRKRVVARSAAPKPITISSDKSVKPSMPVRPISSSSASSSSDSSTGPRNPATPFKSGTSTIGSPKRVLTPKPIRFSMGPPALAAPAFLSTSLPASRLAGTKAATHNNPQQPVVTEPTLRRTASSRILKPPRTETSSSTVGPSGSVRFAPDAHAPGKGDRTTAGTIGTTTPGRVASKRGPSVGAAFGSRVPTTTTTTLKTSIGLAGAPQPRVTTTGGKVAGVATSLVKPPSTKTGPATTTGQPPATSTTGVRQTRSRAAAAAAAK
ncbi:hypothetical protein HKX48_007459 [Thoreauomyces humboldtii]|nr:hypothetical protein HKX48_007459 [Thoreauomyces humboldtii]